MVSVARSLKLIHPLQQSLSLPRDSLTLRTQPPRVQNPRPQGEATYKSFSWQHQPRLRPKPASKGWAHRRFQHPAETPDMVSGDKIPRCALADFLAHKLPEHHKWSFYTTELESNVLCGHRHCHSPLEENESGEAQPFPALRLETNFSHVSSLRENREARN